MKSNMPASSWKKPIHVLAFGFGSGASPFAPGTMGTLVAIPLFLILYQLPLYAYLFVVVLFSLAGVWICQRCSRELGVHDHSGIVWDEIVGYLITMIAIPVNLWTLLLGFLLFRLFDIWKPWPIRYLDREMQGGLGIMLDDILAGIISWAVLFTGLHFIPWLN